MGCRSVLQGIVPTQGSNLGLPHCRQILYHLSHQRSPRNLIKWVDYCPVFYVSEFCLCTWRAQSNTDWKLFLPSPVLPTFPLESEGQGITWLLRKSHLHIHKVLSWRLKKHFLTLTIWETVHVAGQRVYGKFLYLLLIFCEPKIVLNNKVY